MSNKAMNIRLFSWSAKVCKHARHAARHRAAQAGEVESPDVVGANPEVKTSSLRQIEKVAPADRLRKTPAARRFELAPEEYSDRLLLGMPGSLHKRLTQMAAQVEKAKGAAKCLRRRR